MHGFRKEFASILQRSYLQLASRKSKIHLGESKIDFRSSGGQLKDARKPQRHQFFEFFVTFSLILEFFGRQRGPQEWPRDPKDTPRGAQMPPEVPRESPMRPLETLRGPFSRVQSRCRSKRNAIVAFRAHSGGFSDDVGLPRPSSDMRFVS